MKENKPNCSRTNEQQDSTIRLYISERRNWVDVHKRNSGKEVLMKIIAASGLSREYYGLLKILFCDEEISDTTSMEELGVEDEAIVSIETQDRVGIDIAGIILHRLNTKVTWCKVPSWITAHEEREFSFKKNDTQVENFCMRTR